MNILDFRLTAPSVKSSCLSAFIINFCINVCTPFNLTNNLLLVSLSAVKLLKIPNAHKTD
jgi:hypothetical protein